MLFKNPDTGHLEHMQSFQHDGATWAPTMGGREDDAVDFRSIYDPYLGEGTIWQRDISDMPIDPRSDEMAQAMWDVTAFSPGGGFGSKTSFNTTAYGTEPYPAYVVDSTHPDCTWQIMESAALHRNGAFAPPEAHDYITGPIPMASWMTPAHNGDRGLVIYDNGTGIIREWFGVSAVLGADGKPVPGRWKAATGGYSIVRPGLRHLAEDNWATKMHYGNATVSCMHNTLGFVGAAEVRRGRIEHALAFTAAAMRSKDGPSWPSGWADGKIEMFAPGGLKYDPENPHHYHDGVIPYTPTHGQWGRVKADVDPMFNPRTGRPYRPLTRLLIDAAKRYGMTATDTNLWCHSFNAEQGFTEKHLHGVDPWGSGGDLRGYLTDPVSGEGGLNCADFPWDRTEWAPMNWGEPSPNWDKPSIYGPAGNLPGSYTSGF